MFAPEDAFAALFRGQGFVVAVSVVLTAYDAQRLPGIIGHGGGIARLLPAASASLSAQAGTHQQHQQGNGCNAARQISPFTQRFRKESTRSEEGAADGEYQQGFSVIGRHGWTPSYIIYSRGAQVFIMIDFWWSMVYD